MKCVVTGCAGFIGSHLTERLLALGYDVTGIDCFTPYYSRAVKRSNLARALRQRRFRFLEQDLLRADLGRLLRGASYVFHKAAQPGVFSWGQNFPVYEKNNVLATQRLLEAAKTASLKKFIYASSSSVYGNSPLPMREDGPTRPVSPYGVTKLAGEHLVLLYGANFGLPAVSLRYFNVFGPRQRPDMLFHKCFSAIAGNRPLTVYGDGRQTREVTYVLDVVEANILAMRRSEPGEIYNVGGGSRASVADFLAIMQRIMGRKARIVKAPRRRGDARDTQASMAKSRRELGFKPVVGLEQGLREQANWMSAVKD